MHKEKEKFRTLKDLYKNLQVYFEELKTSHNNLKESCEKLKEAQKPSCVDDIVVVTKDVGVTLDLLDNPTSEPHTTNILCDKCKMSLMNDIIVCDESQVIVENEMLVGKLNALTHDLEKAYGGKAKLDFISRSQRCSLKSEGLVYVPKKVRIIFAKQNTIFMNEYGKVCHKCHKKEHIEKKCPKSKNVSFTHFDHCYVLTHNAKGVHAKSVGTSIVGNKMKDIWVPKTLVPNNQGPKQVWVSKRD
jgi:phage FluMu protein Com